MEKFERLNLNKQLTSIADGMPVVRDCIDTEILLSFWDDEGAEGFIYWWEKEGAKFFQEHINERDGKKTPGKFKKVNFLDELTLLTDDRPAFRNCLEFEVMLKFIEAEDAKSFEHWWEETATFNFNSWFEDWAA